MVSEGVKGVEFYVANTDLQILNISPVENKLVLGREITKGLGAVGIRKMENVPHRKASRKFVRQSKAVIWYLLQPV